MIGGSGGIGSAVCHALAKAGNDVALTFRTRADAAQSVVDTLEGNGKYTSHRVDTSDATSVEQLFSEVLREHDKIHTIVHAAGSKIDQPYISELDFERWRQAIDDDVHGFFHVMRTALPSLRQTQGSMVFVSSAGLKRHPPGDVLSVAPKGAIEALVRGLAREEGRHGVRANSVPLGIIDAGMFPELVKRGELDQAYLDAARKNIALRRFGDAADVAEAVVFLASRSASYITGQTLYIDGGYSI